MNQSHTQFPTCYESKRLRLRSYQPGDGKWYYAMSVKNRPHLMRYEADNVAFNITDEEAAEELICELAKERAKGNCFFFGAFEKQTGEFVAQIYVGTINRKLPEFEVGYFAEVDHEGKGYVTEAVKATLQVIFKQLMAHRVRILCDETNLRSIRVAERMGMTREGYLREDQRNPEGGYNGSFIFGLLDREYWAGDINSPA